MNSIKNILRSISCPWNFHRKMKIINRSTNDFILIGSLIFKVHFKILFDSYFTFFVISDHITYENGISLIQIESYLIGMLVNIYLVNSLWVQKDFVGPFSYKQTFAPI